jgi:deoxycytidine triphosphate deaminase
VILTAKKLAHEIRQGNRGNSDAIAIIPEPDLISLESGGEASVNLRLGRWFLTMRQSNETVISPVYHGNRKIGKISKQHFVPFAKEFVLHPNRFVLASTLEWIRLPSTYAAFVVGKSSLGRRGIIIETAAGIHPGFCGCLTLVIRGAMTFFSWPSRGKTASYMADEATIEASESAIAQFMSDVATKANAHAVHIIVHSMGNRGVLRAICRITDNAEQLSRVRFKQIILAAPDVDVDVFRQLCGAYSMVSARTTLYVCAKDRAVEASGWLHQFSRVGLTPPICVVSGIDTVEVTDVDLTNLGHGYIAEARDVLGDIHDLITHGTAPDRRFRLLAQSTLLGERFWVVRA